MTAPDPATPAGARALARLAGDKIGWLTTVDADGQPQSSPIWFLWLDDEIFFYSRRTARRNAILREHPAVAFNLNTDASGDEVVTMEGIARFDETGPPSSQHPAYLAKYLSAIEGYGWDAAYFDREYPFVVRIAPTRWRVD
jgi:PPOX class probable F420-dependent enzyme